VRCVDGNTTGQPNDGGVQSLVTVGAGGSGGGWRRADLADPSVAVRTRVVAGRSQCTTSRGSRADWRIGRDGGCLVLLLPACGDVLLELTTAPLLCATKSRMGRGRNRADCLQVTTHDFAFSHRIGRKWVCASIMRVARRAGKGLQHHLNNSHARRRDFYSDP
jgi:hypothetical protein